MITAIALAARLWTLTPDLPPLDEVGAAPVLVIDAALRHGVDPAWAWSVAWRESRFRWWRVSSAGCVGPFQIQPRYYGPANSPRDQVYTGARTLAEYSRTASHEAMREWNCGRGGARRNPECGASFADDVIARHTQLRHALRGVEVAEVAP